MDERNLIEWGPKIESNDRLSHANSINSLTGLVLMDKEGKEVEFVYRIKTP